MGIYDWDSTTTVWDSETIAWDAPLLAGSEGHRHGKTILKRHKYTSTLTVLMLLFVLIFLYV